MCVWGTGHREVPAAGESLEEYGWDGRAATVKPTRRGAGCKMEADVQIL
jgi:hypothetical protein